MLYLIKITSYDAISSFKLLKKINKIKSFSLIKKQLITVIKSPFIFKKSREQFHFQNITFIWK